MTGSRRLLAAVVVAVAVAACVPEQLPPEVAPASPQPSASAAPADVPASVAPDAGPTDAPADGGGGGAQTDDGGGPSDDAAPAAPGGGGGETTPPAPSLTAVSEHGRTGSNGPAYLRGDRPRLVLEVDLQEGVPYGDAAIEHAAAVLARESNAEVVVQRGRATSTRRDVWTVPQLADAAAASRDVAIDDATVVLHLLVLRGRYETDGVLGLAFDATTAVVFPERWQDLATLVVSDAGIARAVTLHEVGHLLGLVGLAGPPTSDHEDPDHPGHTTDDDDVMFHAVETTLVANLAGGPPDDFGPRTRADLAAMREG